MGNSMPQANNMDANIAAGKLKYSIFNQKVIWRVYLMGFQAKTKTLGSRMVCCVCVCSSVSE